MKRVLCLIDSLGPGGAQRQLVGLASLLKEEGYDVTVACYHNYHFYDFFLQSNGIPFIFLKKANKASFRILHIARFIRRLKPYVVISYLETPSICACIAHLFNRSFKLIVSERNTTQQTGWREKIRFQLFRLADYVVPNAYSQETYIRSFFPKLANKIVTIPNFVDLEYFIPIKKKKRKGTAEIIVAATIWPSKNTFGFIDVVSQLKAKGLALHISWYGKDNKYIDYFNKCLLKITQLGISDFIELKGKTRSIKDKYQEADFFCLPSFYEGTPNVICEAMACGLPILCSDVCDNNRYVKEGENGFLFDPKDTESVVSAFERALSLSYDEYERFCFRGRAIAEEMFSKKEFLKGYINLIERV